MPKHDSSSVFISVFGRVPRKTLSVKKVVKKRSGNVETKKGARKTKVQKKDKPATLEVFGLDEHVSASPTPPTPCSPRSPTYDREPWWDPVISLTHRMDAATASIKDLKDRVKFLEEERDKHRADGSVLDNCGTDVGRE